MHVSGMYSGLSTLAPLRGTLANCSQVWYTGPLAAKTGDIGFEVALVLAPILYVPLRWIELKYRPA